MKKNLGVGDKVKVKNGYFEDDYYVPKGAEHEISSIDVETKNSYFCRCLAFPVMIWLKRVEFDVVE